MKQIEWRNGKFEMTETAVPVATGRDLLVKIEAVSINPVDMKVRKGGGVLKQGPHVFGWDAVGTVAAVGPEAKRFRVGERVFYAGALLRSGTNAEQHLVDERIVGHAPKTLNAAEAAALPLTAITAWEGLFDRLALQAWDPYRGQPRLLVIGGAGGVASIAIQFARVLTGAEIIGTASRPESKAWVEKMGAHFVLNHTRDLGEELERIGRTDVHYIFNVADTDKYFETMARIIAPQGKISSIVESRTPLDLNLLKNKSASFSWELMFTRPMFGTDDMHRQGELLDRVATLIDEGRIRTTLQKTLHGFSAENVQAAHEAIESGRTVGKIALTW